jgi:hypothetical protein
MMDNEKDHVNEVNTNSEENNVVSPEVVVSQETTETVTETVEKVVSPEVVEEALAEVSSQETTEVVAETTESVTEVKEEVKEEEVIDYSSLDKEGLLAVSETLLKEIKESERPNFKGIDKRIKLLKDYVSEINKTERQETEAKYVETNGSKEGFNFQQDELIKSFYDNAKAIKEVKQAYFDGLEKEKQKNLVIKKGIIEEIKALINKQGLQKEKVAKTEKKEGESTKPVNDFDVVKELQKKWKETGYVPQADNERLFQSYRATLDLFYNQKTMEREMRDFDRQRNYDAKIKIIEKAEALVDMENINDAVRKLNFLHQEYKNIGHVARDQQQVLWDRFKVASDKLYDRKHIQTEKFKQELNENMLAKQNLCLEIEAIATFTSEKIGDWQEKTKELKVIEDKWKAIGAVPHEVAKVLSKQFWANLKQFFTNKNGFFEKLDEMRKENLVKKEALCERAEALKDGFEWDDISKKLQGLQKEWKEIGRVSRQHQESIYARFKTACDFFFERRRNRRKEQDKEFEYNLTKKKEICEEIAKLAEAKETDTAKLEALHEQWAKVGFVPRKNMNSIGKLFSQATSSFLENAGLTEEEKDNFLIKIEIKAVEKNPRAKGRTIEKKEADIQRRITGLQHDIELWKNNIEFFAKSSTADKLREEFNKKIAVAQEEITMYRKQSKALANLVKKEEA